MSDIETKFNGTVFRVEDGADPAALRNPRVWATRLSEILTSIPGVRESIRLLTFIEKAAGFVRLEMSEPNCYVLGIDVHAFGRVEWSAEIYDLEGDVQRCNGEFDLRVCSKPIILHVIAEIVANQGARTILSEGGEGL